MTDILEHRRMVDALQSTIDEQKHALDILEKALAAREQAAKALQANLEDHQTRSVELATAISTHEYTINDLRGKLAEQDSVIAGLRGELAQGAEARANTETTSAYKLALTLTLANAAYDALMVLDENQRVIAINTSAETLFERARPIGERLGSVTGSPEIEMMVDNALAYQEESFEEQIIINKRTYRVRVQVIPRDRHTFIGLALQDITELVRLNRARRDMVANISHELRTPIANIRLTIDSIFHEQAKPKGKASRSALKAIARETDSLLWLVQELLDLSMIESGQAILRMVDVPAELLVDEAIERLRDQSEFKSIAITGIVPEGIQVLCDRDQARRVLINLIHNAIKWSPPGETIRVEVRDGEDEVTFAVIDNGPGVPDDHTERIFERFYQVDPARSKGDGSGLGLAICKHIVEAHGGRIWAEGNSHGGGGRFLFTLPKADGRTNAADSSEFA
jgi:two-component system, OmpR family, phosphate regulon sensor histidine kinase PhoR